MTKTSTFPLRLPVSLKAALERLSKEDGVSINQYVVLAVAEKVSAMHTAAFFEERRAAGNLKAFRRILNRKSEPPRPGDEITPEKYNGASLGPRRSQSVAIGGGTATPTTPSVQAATSNLIPTTSLPTIFPTAA